MLFTNIFLTCLCSVACFKILKFPSSSTTRRCLIPKDIAFDASQIEITKVLGKIEIVVDTQTLQELSLEFERYADEKAVQSFQDWLSNNKDIKRAVSVRIFDARLPGNNRCFIKVYDMTFFT